MPKQTSRDRLIILEQNMHNVEKTINRIELKLDKFIENEKINRESFEKKFTDKCAGFDEKYASKRIEKIVDSGVWIIVSTVLLAVLGLVIIQGI